MRSIFCFILLLLFSQVHAQIFYISATGSDAVGNGSANSPWRTLAKACNTVTQAGSIIHVKAGIYTETEQAQLAPGVSIEGEDSSSVIRSAIRDDWKEILSLRSEEGTNGNQHIANIVFDGQDLSTFWAVYVGGRSHVSIHDCRFLNFKDRGVIFSGRNDDKAEAPAVYAKGNRFFNNILLNCAAYNTPNGVYGRGCLNIGGQDSMLIYNNRMQQNQRPNGYNGYLIKYHNDGYLKDVKIFNNTLIKIPFAGNYGGDNGWDFAIECWNVEGGMEIYGNTIQGAIDIVTTTRGMYKYGVWIHDNRIGQPVLNSHFESGIIFEVSNESVIVENNTLQKVSGGILFYPQENTVLSDIIIRNNRFEQIGRQSGNGNNGNGIHISAGSLHGNTNRYTLSNLLVQNNRFIAAENNAPFYGIEITGAAAANGIHIKKNTIQGFTAAWLVANPANVIDSLVLEENILSGNGHGNEPLFMVGAPAHLLSNKNSKSGAAPPGAGFNIREQVLRPIYYEARSINPMQAIALLSLLLFLLFARKEIKYAFPAIGLYAGLSALTSYLDEQVGQALLYGSLFIPAVYGWIAWRKRDRKGHRVVRIGYSSGKALQMQLAGFGIAYLLLFVAFRMADHYFTTGIIPWIDAFFFAALLTATGTMCFKRMECWYWIAGACAAGIASYLLKHYLFNSCYYALLLIVSVWAFFKWKKRMTRVRV